MVHFYYFINRKPGLSETEFHRYWREVHGPIAARVPQFRRYVQSHRIPFADSNLPFDGAAEIWLDGIEAVGELRREPIFRDGALRDEPNFIDIERVEWVVSDDHVMLDGPQGEGMAKAVFRFRRKPGMRLKHFRRYWLRGARCARGSDSRPAPLRAIAHGRRGLPICGTALGCDSAAMVRR